MSNLWQRVYSLWGEFWKTLTFIKVSRIFLALFFLTFPFQIRTILYSLPFNPSGEFDYYTTFFLYLSDIFFIVSFLFWGISLLKKETAVHTGFGDDMLSFLFLALLFLMMGYSFFVAQPELHFFLTFRFIELLLLYFMVINRVLRQQEIVILLLVGFCFQSFVAMYQYINQGSIGLTFLGEPVATANTLGVAKINLGNQTFLRAFGTMPQANVLGGLLFMGIIYAIALLKRNRWLTASILFLFVMGLLFSFSRSAFLALIAAFLIYISVQNTKSTRSVIKYILLATSILVFLIVIFNLEGFLQKLLFDDFASIQERGMYLNISFNMLMANPLGVGLGGFTLFMQDYVSTKLTPWLFQPVHNIFLLAANELGIVGGLLFLAIFIYSFIQLLKVTSAQRTPENRFSASLLLAMLTGIMVIGLFDHYFFTIYQGQIMLFTYFGFVSSLLSSVRLPAKNS